MESLQKKLAQARETTDYEALEVVQKTIEAVQKKFADEVCIRVHFVVYFVCMVFLLAVVE